MARLTRAESKANTRVALLDAAEHEFASAGYHATTVDRIVERAGFTRGAFYAHFADKADVFLTLLEDRNEGNLQALRAQLDEHDWDDHTAFLAWFDRGMAHVGPVERAFAEFQSVAASTPEYAARLARRLHDVHASVAELVRTAAANTGVQLTLAPEQFAMIATALVDGFTTQHQLDPASAPPQLLSDAIEMLWEAATREADAAPTSSGRARR
jgi:AcrR family transcriptional regulator